MIAPDSQHGSDGNGNGNGHGHGHAAGGTATAPVRPTRRALPPPRVEKAHLAAWLIWLVPIGVAVGAGIYFYRIYQQLGPEVTIEVSDATGIRTEESYLVVRGVKVATVNSVGLAPDNVHALLHLRFQRGTGGIANTGTVFYMVRPEISGGNVMGLGTIVSGPYLEAIVGHGDPATSFVALDGPPVMRGAGMRVIIHAARVDHLAVDAPVYYRGAQVGVVQDIRLASDSTGVNVTAFIWLRYCPLLRTTSVFWPMPTATVKGGLFEGISVNLATLRTLLGGGIAFATPPEGMGRLAQDGSQFDLAVDGPKPAWLAWAPKIPLGPDPLEAVESGHGEQRRQGVLQSALRVR